MTYAKALKLFELSEGYTKRDVDKSFRKISMQYHPDKVANLGQELKDLAHQKMVEAGEAKEILLKRL